MGENGLRIAGSFSKVFFLSTFFPLSLSLSGPARHPIKGTVAPPTFLFLPPPILPGEGCMVEIGYSDSRDPFLDWAEKDPVRSKTGN